MRGSKSCGSCDCSAYAQNLTPQFASCAHAQHRKATYRRLALIMLLNYCAARMPKTKVASYLSQRKEEKEVVESVNASLVELESTPPPPKCKKATPYVYGGAT